MTNTPCQLYAITPPSITLSQFMPELQAALETGAIGCVQLRLKEASTNDVREAALAMLPLTHEYEVPLILNDALDLAHELDVDGVHLGQEDLLAYGSDPHKSTLNAIRKVRKRLSDELALGITCHASSHLAMEAGEAGADYVAFGAFYPTTSKPKEKLEKWGTPSIELLTQWSEGSTVPCVAIGGITPQNCAPLVRAGADFIAAITGIWNHPQGAAAGALAYQQAIAEAVAG